MPCNKEELMIGNIVLRWDIRKDAEKLIFFEIPDGKHIETWPEIMSRLS